MEVKPAIAWPCFSGLLLLSAFASSIAMTFQEGFSASLSVKIKILDCHVPETAALVSGSVPEGSVEIRLMRVIHVLLYVVFFE
jgi:hypothetical protein